MFKTKQMAVALFAGVVFVSASADESIYTVTVPVGETNEFTAAQIAAVNSGDYGVLAKRGGGCLVGTNAISSFAGEIRIEEGAYWIKYNGELGTKDGATVVSNGAAIYVNTPAAHLGENQLKFEYETFYFAGEGVSGEGAFCNRSPRDQYNFFNFANIFLTGDTLFTSKYRLDVRATASVPSVWDLGGHKFTYRCVDSGIRTFSPTWGAITNMADMVVNHANLYFSDGRWFPEPGHTITLTNQAQLNLSFRYPSRFEGPSGIWRSGLDLSSSSSIYTEPSSRPFSDCRSGTNIFNFAGPIRLSGTVYVTGGGFGTPFTFGGAVSGAGTLNVTKQRLQFASGENTYAGKIVVTGDAVTNSGIRLYKGANMPPCGGQAITMSNAQLFLDENSTFNIGEVDFSGDGEIVGGLATGTVRSAMSKLVKTGDGTLVVDASLDVTGDALIEGGTLKLGLPRVGNPGLGEGWFHCKRSGEPGTVYDFYNYQGATAWNTPALGYCRIWRHEGPAAVFSRAEWFYYKHVVYHGWVWNRTSENVNWSIAGSVGRYASLYIDGTKVVAPSGQGINNGYVELTPGAHEITITMSADLMRHDNEDKAFPGPTIGAYTEWWPWKNCGLGYDPQGRVTAAGSTAASAKQNILNYFQPFKDPGDGSLFTIDNKTPEQIDQTIYHPVFSNLVMASSATLDLNGNTRFSVPKLTGFPHVTNGTLKVSGKWTLPAAELNAGGVMRVDGALDFADGALVSLDDMSQVVRRNFCNGQAIASATEGITGNPSFDRSQSRHWHVKKSADGRSLTLLYAGHFQVVIR